MPMAHLEIAPNPENACNITIRSVAAVNQLTLTAPYMEPLFHT